MDQSNIISPGRAFGEEKMVTVCPGEESLESPLYGNQPSSKLREDH